MLISLQFYTRKDDKKIWDNALLDVIRYLFSPWL